MGLPKLSDSVIFLPFPSFTVKSGAVFSLPDAPGFTVSSADDGEVALVGGSEGAGVTDDKCLYAATATATSATAETAKRIYFNPDFIPRRLLRKSYGVILFRDRFRRSVLQNAS